MQAASGGAALAAPVGVRSLSRRLSKAELREQSLREIEV